MAFEENKRKKLEQALEQHQFEVYYQPKYDLTTECVIGAEALIRWIHPEKGVLSPAAFLCQFKENDLMMQLDEYVWESACKSIRQWLDLGYPITVISVNVSQENILNPKLIETLKSLVEKYQIPVGNLHLEINESVYTENTQFVIEVARKLREYGFFVEMDNFGTGCTSVNMLAEMPVDVLKLDMNFIQSETSKTSGKGVLSFLIGLANWLNLSVVAEGVETADQITMLRSLDCNYVQGFYYAKPMPKEEFEELLKTASISEMNLSSLSGHNFAKTEKVKNIGRKMVVVDDLEVNRKVLAQIFEDEYDIVEMENGKLAWEYIESYANEVEIVLLDLLMPVMDGFQFLKNIHLDERTQDITVIVTSQGNAQLERRALEMKADDFISKPYNPEVVRQRVHNVIGNRRLQKMQRQKLDEIQQKERTLLESIPGGVAIYRLKKDGKIATEYVSEGLAKLFGYSAQEFLEMNKEDVRVSIHPEDLVQFEEITERKLKSHAPIHMVMRVFTKEGKTIPVRMDANLISGGNLGEDDRAMLYTVHTRVPQENENIVQEQMRYRYILDNLDVAYFELDENGGFYASDKYSLYMMSTQSINNILADGGEYGGVHPDDLPILFEFFNLKNKKMPKVSATLRMKMKDDTYHWTELIGFFEYNLQGERVKSIGVLRDVDQEWLRQNRKLQEALKAAEKANQAKTDFLERVSHDMRTPLNGILGLTNLIKAKVENPEVQQDLQHLEQSGRYLLNLIDDTLDVSKIESGRMELKPVVCDGRTAFDTVIEMVQPDMEEKNIQFNMKAEGLPFTQLYIDVGRVQQTVINILSNAIKFTPLNGKIDFVMENLSNENGVITDKIIIRDNGIGMSEKFQEYLFQPFMQEHNDSKSIYQGTGLGLIISKQCLELMGGSLSIKSKEGEGTEVTIILPMPIATKEQIRQWSLSKETNIELKTLKGKRILLCEDHILNATIAKRLLEKQGMIVEHAANGKIGVEMFHSSILNYYDAVLMDIRMPVMNGLEATRNIRKLRRSDAKEIPIIAMTANAFNEDIKNAINAGMSEHLAKPIEPSKLYATLAKYILQTNPHLGRDVLIVDDIAMNRDFVRKAIESSYSIVEASNGQEALEMLKRDKNIVAVVTDIQMPVMDGKELIRNIRLDKNYDQIAILANTIYGDHRQEEELLNLGANDFVYKPSSPGVIRMRLEHILRNI